MSASWSDLPGDILQLIFHKLRLPSDVLQCALVCVSWQSAIRPLYHQHKSIFQGLLLFSGHKRRESKYCQVFNSESSQGYRILLPEIQGRWFSGTTYGGWLLTIGNGANETEIHLLNLFTRARIRLPPGKRFKNPEFTRLESKKPEVTRVIASTSPADPACKLLAVHPGKHTYRFSFCRPGDQAWISINNFVGRCSDAIFYNGEFYAVDSFGCLWLIRSEFKNGYPKAVKLDIIPVTEYHYRCYYLVEVWGELCLAVRDSHFSSTLGRFAFYMMDWCSKTWVCVRHFGDYAVFLGRFGSFSQPTGKQETSSASFRRAQQKGSCCIHFIDDQIQKISSPRCRNSTSLYYSAKGQYFRCILNGPIKASPLTWIVPEL